MRILKALAIMVAGGLLPPIALSGAANADPLRQFAEGCLPANHNTEGRLRYFISQGMERFGADSRRRKLGTNYLGRTTQADMVGRFKLRNPARTTLVRVESLTNGKKLCSITFKTAVPWQDLLQNVETMLPATIGHTYLVRIDRRNFRRFEIPSGVINMTKINNRQIKIEWANR